MKTKLCFIILFIPLILTGCWDLTEIESRNYVINMGIDHEDGHFIVTYGMAWDDDEEKVGSVKNVSGESFAFIIENSDISSEKKTFLGHTKTLIFGENLLQNRKAFSEVIATLKNFGDFSAKTLVAVCESSARDAVEAVSEEKQMYIWNFYRTNAKDMGHVRKTTFEDVKMQIEKEGTAIIPLMNAENGEISFTGCGIISQGVLSRNLTQSQSQLLYLLNGYGEGSLFEENDLIFRINTNKRRVKLTDGICRISLDTKGEIIYSKDEASPEDIEAFLEGELNDFFENEILKLPAGDYCDIGKYLIKNEDVNINSISYEDFSIEISVNFREKA